MRTIKKIKKTTNDNITELVVNKVFVSQTDYKITFVYVTGLIHEDFVVSPGS